MQQLSNIPAAPRGAFQIEIYQEGHLGDFLSVFFKLDPPTWSQMMWKCDPEENLTW